jgi:hypothetical protein
MEGMASANPAVITHPAMTTLTLLGIFILFVPLDLSDAESVWTDGTPD